MSRRRQRRGRTWTRDVSMWRSQKFFVRKDYQCLTRPNTASPEVRFLIYFNLNHGAKVWVFRGALNCKLTRSELWWNSSRTELCFTQVFFDLMREIRARKNEVGPEGGGKKDKKGGRKKIKCSILWKTEFKETLVKESVAGPTFNCKRRALEWEKVKMSSTTSCALCEFVACIDDPSVTEHVVWEHLCNHRKLLTGT